MHMTSWKYKKNCFTFFFPKDLNFTSNKLQKDYDAGIRA